MKKNQSNCNPFTATVNHATEKNIQNRINISRFLKMSVVLTFIVAFLVSTTSCSRTEVSGCGAWPVAKYNKTKDSREFNNYKRYN